MTSKEHLTKVGSVLRFTCQHTNIVFDEQEPVFFTLTQILAFIFFWRSLQFKYIGTGGAAVRQRMGDGFPCWWNAVHRSMFCNSTPLVVGRALSTIYPVVLQVLIPYISDIAVSHVEQKYLFIGWNFLKL